MSEPSLLRAQEAGVLTLTLNRPERLNALTHALLQDLRGAFEEAQSSAAVRVVLLTGAGRGFCAGQDVSAGEPIGDYGEHLRQNFNPLITAMQALEKPIVAAINGPVAGAGLSLALQADLRLWSQAASMSTAFSSIGLVPDAGLSAALPRLLGYAKAFELAALSEKLSAEQAVSLGLGEKLLPAEDFGEQAQAYALRLAERPLHALMLTKRALKSAPALPLAEVLEQEAKLQAQAGAHKEHAEGMAAFAERRAANFLGLD